MRANYNDVRGMDLSANITSVSERVSIPFVLGHGKPYFALPTATALLLPLIPLARMW